MPTTVPPEVHELGAVACGPNTVKVIGPLGAEPPVKRCGDRGGRDRAAGEGAAQRAARREKAVVGAAVRSRPCWCPELSVYSPTAVQLPGVAQDTERSRTSGSAPAFNGNVA